MDQIESVATQKIDSVSGRRGCGWASLPPSPSPPLTLPPRPTTLKSPLLSLPIPPAAHTLTCTHTMFTTCRPPPFSPRHWQLRCSSSPRHAATTSGGPASVWVSSGIKAGESLVTLSVLKHVSTACHEARRDVRIRHVAAPCRIVNGLI